MFQCQRRVFFRASATALVGALLSLTSACGGGGGSDTDAASLSLSIFTEVAGTSYRLSNTSFEVSGGELAGAPVTLDTGAAPTELSLQRALEPGAYNIELKPNWVLERESGTGFAAVAGATLTSGNPLPVSVVQGQIARVGFAFDAAGVPVDFQQDAGEDDNAD